METVIFHLKEHELMSFLSVSVNKQLHFAFFLILFDISLFLDILRDNIHEKLSTR